MPIRHAHTDAHPDQVKRLSQRYFGYGLVQRRLDLHHGSLQHCNRERTAYVQRGSLEKAIHFA